MSVQESKKPLVVRVIEGYHPEGPGASSAKQVLQIMASWADQDGSNSFLARDSIAFYTKFSRSTVKRAIARLKEEAMITAYDSPRAQRIPSEFRPVQYWINVGALSPRSPSEAKDAPLNEEDEPAHHDPEGGSPRTPTLPCTPPGENPPHADVEPGTQVSVSADYTTTRIDESEFDRDVDEAPDFVPRSKEEPPSVVTVPVESTPPVAVEYQAVDRKRERFGWRPADSAYESAKIVGKDVNLETLIMEYWLWCSEKQIEPGNVQWMRWVTREQKKIDEIDRQSKLNSSNEARRKRQWYAVAD